MSSAEIATTTNQVYMYKGTGLNHHQARASQGLTTAQHTRSMGKIITVARVHTHTNTRTHIHIHTHVP